MDIRDHCRVDALTVWLIEPGFNIGEGLSPDQPFPLCASSPVLT